jgi:CRISPR-associated endonuclease Csy4
MDHYLDLRIRPDPEFSTTQLMNVLFQKLHLALVDLHSTDIGISFPEVDEKQPTLGRCLRLHAQSERLRELVRHSHLNGLEDYVEIARPTPIPTQTQYRQVRRIQAKSSPERLLRRQMRRHAYADMEAARQAAIKSAMEQHSTSEAEASRRIDRIRTLSLPFVSLRSQSTGQPFRLFIQHGPLENKPTVGCFNSYGLSAAATIPWF